MKPYEETQASTSLIDEMRFFTKVKEHTYYINSPCIFAKNHLITTGQIYLYAECPGTKKFALVCVILQDVVSTDEFVMLHLTDVLTGYEWWLNQSVEPCEEQCEFLLIDPVYVIEKMSKNMASKHDELLEFDF